jgi:hypothetical protein
MRAKNQVRTSLESPPATARGRRRPERSGLRVRWVLLVILAGALTLLALWGPARRGDTPTVSRPSVGEFQQDLSTRTGSMRTTPQAVRVADTPDDLNNASVNAPSIDAAFLAGVAVVLSLVSLSWLFVFRAELRPGITFGFFVPG